MMKLIKEIICNLEKLKVWKLNSQLRKNNSKTKFRLFRELNQLLKDYKQLTKNMKKKSMDSMTLAITISQKMPNLQRTAMFQAKLS